MKRRKGELCPAAIDQGWPYQVALPASALRNGGYAAVHDFCKELTLCPRGHSVFRDQWFNILLRGARACREIHSAVWRPTV
jgi:hypothetical protein